MNGVNGPMHPAIVLRGDALDQKLSQLSVGPEGSLPDVYREAPIFRLRDGEEIELYEIEEPAS